MGLFNKFTEGLRKTRDSMMSKVDQLLHSFTKIDEEFFEELEENLIMADVGTVTAARICQELRRRVKEKGIADAPAVKGEIKEIVAQMLSGEAALDLSTRPSVLLIIGVNGVGKTTTIGKLADSLRRDGKKVLLAAADTFRAAAIEQLEIWAQRAQVEIVRHNEGSDPAAVVFDAIKAGQARGCDVVICDTAGRLHNKKNLMNELSKISRIIDREAPGCARETLLVLDATTGQNALNQARQFKEAAGLTGIILTKLDGTARGGVVIGIKEELGIPIKYVGVGEQIDDLKPFDSREFVEALFEEADSPGEETAPAGREETSAPAEGDFVKEAQPDTAECCQQPEEALPGPAELQEEVSSAALEEEPVSAEPETLPDPVPETNLEEGPEPLTETPDRDGLAEEMPSAGGENSRAVTEEPDSAQEDQPEEEPKKKKRKWFWFGKQN